MRVGPIACGFVRTSWLLPTSQRQHDRDHDHAATTNDHDTNMRIRRARYRHASRSLLKRYGAGSEHGL